ncbi:hypothetical protein K378_00437 [Streptomyces sp. Amel2xB2]|nr:hypothetical protein K378_00437 [Streptomyces sp. Amel2xB2]
MCATWRRRPPAGRRLPLRALDTVRRRSRYGRGRAGERGTAEASAVCAAGRRRRSGWVRDGRGASPHVGFTCDELTSRDLNRPLFGRRCQWEGIVFTHVLDFSAAGFRRSDHRRGQRGNPALCRGPHDLVAGRSRGTRPTAHGLEARRPGRGHAGRLSPVRPPVRPARSGPARANRPRCTPCSARVRSSTSAPFARVPVRTARTHTRDVRHTRSADTRVPSCGATAAADPGLGSRSPLSPDGERTPPRGGSSCGPPRSCCPRSGSPRCSRVR